MPKTKLQKSKDLEILTEKLSRAKSVVFTDYKGLTMTQLSALRDQLRDQGAELSVTKNSLISLALKSNNLTASDIATEGPTATLFSYEDEITPIKTLVKALKDANMGKVKAGILNGESLDNLAVTKLSTLPSKLELQAKVVGTLAAPLQGIVGVLQANLRNFVYALDQIRIQKGGE